MSDRRSPSRHAASSVGLLLLLVAAHPVSAQVFEAVGERAMGMGGAFVAVADDGTATYWNPAGLALGASVDACLSHASSQASSGGVVPASVSTAATSFCLAFPAFGLSYNHLRGSDGGGTVSPTGAVPADRQDLRLRGVGVSSLVTRQAGFTVVHSILPGVGVGATLKYVRASAGSGDAPVGTAASALLEAASQVEGRERSTFDLDLGVIGTAGPVKAGLVVRNVRAPVFETPGGGRLPLHRQVRAGVAVTPGREALLHPAEDGLIVALDVDLTRTPGAMGDRRMIAVGAERWLRGHRLGLRAGARANTAGASARPVGTAGVSVALGGGVFLEGHAARGGEGAERGWGIGVRAGF